MSVKVYDRDEQGYSKEMVCSYCGYYMMKVWSGGPPIAKRLDAWECPHCFSTYYEGKIADPFYQLVTQFGDAQRRFYEKWRGQTP